jgi:hypothetical protein
MVKTLEDADSQKYKKQFDEFVQQINPKPSKADIERLKQTYLDKRSETSVSIRD